MNFRSSFDLNFWLSIGISFPLSSVVKYDAISGFFRVTLTVPSTGVRTIYRSQYGADHEIKHFCCERILYAWKRTNKTCGESIESYSTARKFTNKTVLTHFCFIRKFLGRFEKYTACFIHDLSCKWKFLLQTNCFILWCLRLKTLRRPTCSWKGLLERLWSWKILCCEEISNLTIFRVLTRTWRVLSNIKLFSSTIFPNTVSNLMPVGLYGVITGHHFEIPFKQKWYNKKKIHVFEIP